MHDLKLHIANTSGSLNKHLADIKGSFQMATEKGHELIDVNHIDVVVVEAPYATIPELGVGGYTPSAHLIYISLNPRHKIKKADLFSSFTHELHHAMRWREPGYGSTLREALVTEGLATLFEEELTDKTPVYASVRINKPQVSEAIKALDNHTYDHQVWFIKGNNKIPRWFGYTFGYRVVKHTSERLDKKASELVHTPASYFKESFMALSQA